jgi:hypothetical protein
MSNREYLKKIAAGQRPGYWIEILHRKEDGALAYAIHYPLPNGRDWHDMPVLPCTLEAVEIMADAYLKKEGAAATLPRYDEGREFSGAIDDADLARALMKWAKI